MGNKIEFRTTQHRIEKIEDEGIVDAYLTAWDSIDSYKTQFQRGCFTKTFKERQNKIKLIWNHQELVGKVIEAREDDYGAFVKVKFNLDTQAGKDAFTHVKAGDVDAFSFGFIPVDDKFVNGIRTFTEVKCLECGPVIFPANEKAIITDARTEDFNKTEKENELRYKGYRLINDLEETINDIFYANSDIDDIMGKIDIAITDFHGAYMLWLSESANMFNNVGYFRCSNNVLKDICKEKIDKDKMVRSSSLTESELDLLLKGVLLPYESRNKLAELPKEIAEAHHKKRCEAVETLCTELRNSGFSQGEKQRFFALLNLDKKPDKIDSALDFIRNFRENLNKEV